MAAEVKVPEEESTRAGKAIRLDPEERSRVLVEMWADLFRHLSTLGAGRHSSGSGSGCSYTK